MGLGDAAASTLAIETPFAMGQLLNILFRRFDSPYEHYSVLRLMIFYLSSIMLVTL